MYVAIGASLLPAIPHSSATGAPCWGVGQSSATVLPVHRPPNSPEGGAVSTALSLAGLQGGSQGLHKGKSFPRSCASDPLSLYHMQGYHEVAEPVYRHLSERVTVARFHHWLSALHLFSSSQLLLSSPAASQSSSLPPPPSQLIPALSSGAALVSKATMLIKVMPL